MDLAHAERMLLAEANRDAALELRSIAEEESVLLQRELALYTAAGAVVPERLIEAEASAARDVRELSRACLLHAARHLDDALADAGQERGIESAVLALPPLV